MNRTAIETAMKAEAAKQLAWVNIGKKLSVDELAAYQAGMEFGYGKLIAMMFEKDEVATMKRLGDAAKASEKATRSKLQRGR